MIGDVIFSADTVPVEWSETEMLKLKFGPKAANLATLPRKWTPPFVLISHEIFLSGNPDGSALLNLGSEFIQRVKEIAKITGGVYVRSSIIGETIWERGSYSSFVVDFNEDDFESHISDAVTNVLKSAPGKQVGLVIQSYIKARVRGEFGNLLRVSKTRDHWELSTESGETISRNRFNTQRDQAANQDSPLESKSRTSRDRLFGSVAAWINNYLLRGKPQRINCEWIGDYKNIYIVQIDEEDEDFSGINPFQIRIAPVHQPQGAEGIFLNYAEGDALHEWDKLSVLNELWEPNASHKPTLFFVPLSKLPSSDDSEGLRKLEEDFRSLIGPDNIVVRTSVKAGADKINNLDRTEGLSPFEAAAWCLEKRNKFSATPEAINNLAFIAHRFMAARSSAWVRAEPGNPVVEIHSLWGLPDGLQYFSYDTWEIHLPTEVATESPDYKSHMLIAQDHGNWEYVRIKNEFGRSLSIGRREAMDLAIRTAAISERLGMACHVMWFVGCVEQSGEQFSIPWYWTKAHKTEKNPDRSNYHIFTISNQSDLENFKIRNEANHKHALEIKPIDQELMRDMKFIGAVGEIAKTKEVPVILAGSTLAHAYFELSRKGCTIVTKGEKEHSRARKSTTFGKIVRDKIPSRIAKRKEAEITRKIPSSLKKNFLTSKMLEEALEFRNAETTIEKKAELADIYEVLRALAKIEEISMEEVYIAADEKREKAGGFDEGFVLLQTAILGRRRESIQEGDKLMTQLLARKLSGSAYELPFTFFGFMELDQPRSLNFEDIGVRLQITLKSDRVELHLLRQPEQLELSLDLTVNNYEEADE